MGTLYDLLGALPNDDAEALRIAFRKAAKATHPDTNPDNPDAAMRFRQLVRAHGILNDAEQRATYDQLLAIAVRPPRPPAPPARIAVYEKIHRGATNTMAATLIAAALIAGYTVFSHISKTSAMTDGTVRTAEGAPAEPAAAAQEPTGTVGLAIDRRETLAAINERDMTGTIAAAANAINPPLAVISLPVLAATPVPAPADAKTLHERGIYAYRGGDLSGALAHFNRAIAQDPGFAPAYVDRGIVFYRMRKFENAFADMAHAKRLAKSGKDAGNASKDKPKSVVQAPEKPPAAIVAAAAPPRWRMMAATTP